MNLKNNLILFCLIFFLNSLLFATNNEYSNINALNVAPTDSIKKNEFDSLISFLSDLQEIIDLINSDGFRKLDQKQQNDSLKILIYKNIGRDINYIDKIVNILIENEKLKNDNKKLFNFISEVTDSLQSKGQIKITSFIAMIGDLQEGLFDPTLVSKLKTFKDSLGIIRSKIESNDAKEKTIKEILKKEWKNLTFKEKRALSKEVNELAIENKTLKKLTNSLYKQIDEYSKSSYIAKKKLAEKSFRLSGKIHNSDYSIDLIESRNDNKVYAKDIEYFYVDFSTDSIFSKKEYSLILKDESKKTIASYSITEKNGKIEKKNLRYPFKKGIYYISILSKSDVNILSNFKFQLD